MVRFLEDNDVISFPLNSIEGHHVFKVGDLKHHVKEHLKGKDPQKYLEIMLDYGQSCEVMTTDNPGWKKGKIKIAFQIEIEEQE